MTELYVATAAFGVTRRFTSRAPELRDIGGAKHIAGYASVFNKSSRNLGGFVERIDRRAFDQAMLAGWPDVICRYNHDDNFLLGTTRGGTLDLRTDETGLWYDVIPPSFRADIVELCARGDVTQSSFAFRVPEEGDYWERSGPGGMPLRTVVNTELVDTAPVNTPAYSEATASARQFYDDDLVMSLARFKECEMAEVRGYLADSGNVAKFFRRSDRPSVPQEEPEMTTPPADDEDRKKLTSKDRADLPDSAFAYIAPDGTKHFPIHDAAHVRNALARIAQGAQFGKEALPKVKAAAKRFGIDSAEQNAWAQSLAEVRGVELPEWFASTEAEEEREDEDRADAPAPKGKSKGKPDDKPKGNPFADKDDESDDDEDDDDDDDDDAKSDASAKKVKSVKKTAVKRSEEDEAAEAAAAEAEIREAAMRRRYAELYALGNPFENED